MKLPPKVQQVLDALHTAGFEAYVVGGCVRDLLLNKEPHDWDVTTNARPEEIQTIFPRHFYNNRFGTVTVLVAPRNENDPATANLDLSSVEVTTYRIDANYSDQRHPDNVKFTDNVTHDLARRDFTINAMAGIPSDQHLSSKDQKTVTIEDITIIDPFGGIKDLNAKIIRAVGDPGERFSEDALRLLRAVRFAAQLDFTIEDATMKDVTAYADSIRAVSAERIRDELIKIVMSQHPEYGFTLLHQTGLLAMILPELQEGIGVGQNKHHIYTVFEHNIKSLQFASEFDYSLTVRLAALLHDIGKPRTKRQQGNDYTFYAHDIVGARMAEKILRRFKFPNEVVANVTHLVRHHMFYYDVGKVTEAGARRLLRRVGQEHFDDLIKLRIAERKGSGVPKAEPYRLRHLQFLVEKAAQEPITVGQLIINGADLLTELALRPGPQIGGILNALLAEVLDDPTKNERGYLLQRATELKDSDPATLKQLGEAAKDTEEQKREDDIKRKYHV